MNKQQAELHSQSIRCSNQPRNIKMSKQQAELHNHFSSSTDLFHSLKLAKQSSTTISPETEEPTNQTTDFVIVQFNAD
jgi:hypothetical protein